MSIFSAWKELRNLCACDGIYEALDSASTSIPNSASLAPNGMMTQVSEWFDDNRGRRVCWLKYPSRQYNRRSPIAQFIVDHLMTIGTLAAGIFCSMGQVNSRTFLPTIAFQLGNAIPALKPTIQHIIQDQKEVLLATEELGFAQKLIIEPFLIGDFNFLSSMIIVIDCIGWSDGDEFILTTLIWLEKAFRSYAIPLQVLLLSEPELYMEANLQHPDFLDAVLTLHLPRYESWTANTSISSQLLFVTDGQKIYQVRCISYQSMTMGRLY